MSNQNELKTVHQINVNSDWRTAFVKFSDGTQNSSVPFAEKIKYDGRDTTIGDIIKDKQNSFQKDAEQRLKEIAYAAEQRKETKFTVHMFYVEYLTKDFQEKLKNKTFGKYKITKFESTATFNSNTTYADVEFEQIKIYVNISYSGSTASYSTMPSGAIKLLEDIGSETNNPNIVITSTIRTPEQQANEMYNMGYVKAKGLYLAPGQKVAEVHKQMGERGVSKAEILKAMVDKINELGPTNISSHCYTSPRAFDVSISNLKNPNDFYDAMKKKGVNILDERSKGINCYHIVF